MKDTKKEITRDQAEQLAKYMGIKIEEENKDEEKENILILGDDTTRGIVQPFASLMRESGFYCKLANVDFIEEQRPFVKIPNYLLWKVKSFNILFYAIDKKSNNEIDEVQFRKSLNEYGEFHGLKVGCLLNPTPEAISSAMKADPSEIEELTNKLYMYMRGVNTVQVTGGGNNFTIEFANKGQQEWAKSTGFIEPKVARNLMPAEIYVYPQNVNGKISINGSYAYFTQMEKFRNNSQFLDKLKKNPIIWTVKDGTIIDVHSKDEEIKNHAIKAIEVDEDANKIGEYGMGTNIGIEKCLGNTMHDEKYPGVHVANGYEKPSYGALNSKIHYDGILLEPTVKDLDNKKIIMKKGKYLI